ncbi:hypothetical protein LSAT2_030595 [Lamellibrachia satsuma]|nr:hypothetical protein LSAT2_030595 [Lamellibrachia satsuma]
MECWETSACAQYGARVNGMTYSHPTETPDQQTWHYLGARDNIYEQCCSQPSAGWQHWASPMQQTTFGTPGRCGTGDATRESDCCYRPRENVTSKRNERERNRVRHINSTFGVLQRHLPGSTGKTKKLSKVDTLHAAVKYIKYLQEILSTDQCDWSPPRSDPNSPPTSTASSSRSSSRASSPLSHSLSPASCDSCLDDAKPLYTDLQDAMNSLM